MTLPLFGQLELPFQLPAGPPVKPRRVQIGSRVVEYQLIRARRRTLALAVDHRGLRVSVPNAVSLAEVERFIAANGPWVLDKLDEWRDGQRDRRMAVVSGCVIPVLGEPHLLKVGTGRNGVVWKPGALHLSPAPATAPRDLLLQALKTRALDLFQERMPLYAQRLAVAVPRLALSSAQTRWGSCSRRSGIRLNWRLVHLPLPLVDYVVAHELAHLIEMNHSPRFWSLVERACPHTPVARAELKALATRLPQF